MEVIEANIVSRAGVINELVKRRGDNTWKELAEQIDCSATSLCDVLHGHRRPGKKILEFLGFRTEMVYVKTEQGQ
jgi:hypothetical protein